MAGSGEGIMSKVRVAAFSISIDGFGAGPRQDLQNPLGGVAHPCVLCKGGDFFCWQRSLCASLSFRRGRATEPAFGAEAGGPLKPSFGLSWCCAAFGARNAQISGRRLPREEVAHSCFNVSTCWHPKRLLREIW